MNNDVGPKYPASAAESTKGRQEPCNGSVSSEGGVCKTSQTGDEVQSKLRRVVWLELRN